MVVLVLAAMVPRYAFNLRHQPVRRSLALALLWILTFSARSPRWATTATWAPMLWAAWAGRAKDPSGAPTWPCSAMCVAAVRGSWVEAKSTGTTRPPSRRSVGMVLRQWRMLGFASMAHPDRDYCASAHPPERPLDGAGAEEVVALEQRNPGRCGTPFSYGPIVLGQRRFAPARKPFDGHAHRPTREHRRP